MHPEASIADAMLRALSRRYGRIEQGYSKLGAEREKESFYGGE